MDLLTDVIDDPLRTLQVARVLREAGLITLSRPDRMLRMGAGLLRWGPTHAAGYAIGAALDADRPAIVDENGTLTFAQTNLRTNALAHALSDRGLGEGDRVALMCRNHRGFVETTVACSKLGADVLYLNTAFAGPQITGLLKGEKPKAVIYDQEFAELVAEGGRRRKRFVAWTDGEADDPTLEDLVEQGDPADVVPPQRSGRAVILTSGTTGAPKGADRAGPRSLAPAAALLSRIPLHAREPTLIAAPLFHAWGYAHLSLGLALNSTLVLRRRFDPADALATVERHRVTALVAVPIMLQRIVDLPPEDLDRYDTSSLRAIAVSGSALPARLAERVMDTLGDVLYNLYGSTEVAWATVATPADMRAAPGTAGRPPLGTTVRIVDEEGAPCPPGASGRILVGNDMLFAGYTSGGGRDLVGGLMPTGDLGHFDEDGRLFVDGRDDDMIVSGGENVFPAEVEELLADHPDIAEAAVVGVEDPDFGQRLRAFVVLRPGAELGEQEVKDHVRSRLARYKVPREVRFLKELPRNATGKVLKRELDAG